MRKALAIVLLSVLTWPAFAGFELTGKITGNAGDMSLSMNIPEVYLRNREHNITIPVAPDGSFKITLPLTAQKFAFVFFQKHIFRLLLTPGRNLEVACNIADSSLTAKAGSAFPENDLLLKLNLDEEPRYLWDPGFHNPKPATIADIREKIAGPWLRLRDDRLKTISLSEVPAPEKKLIASEVKYLALNNLATLTSSEIADKTAMRTFIVDLFKTTTTIPEVWPAGVEYFTFLRSTTSYFEMSAIADMKARGLKNNEHLLHYKVSFDSANVVVEKYGKPFFRWIASTNNFPAAATELFTYQELLNIAAEKDLVQMNALLDAFAGRYPSSLYLPVIVKKRNDVLNELRVNANNTNIVVADNYRDIQTITELLKPFPGKVVYLDFWGTWCGPCKAELPYTAALKKHFKDKDIVYVYIDMDAEEQDKAWKDFIVVNGMEGLHIRKSREEIASFWDQLGVEAGKRSYPAYFIFDKTGKLVVRDALRPSNGAALFDQLSAYLEK